MGSIQDQEGRRKFLTRAGKVTLGVPATAMLLSVTHKSSLAAMNEYKGNCGGGNGMDPAPPGGGTGMCGSEFPDESQ